MEIWTWWGGVVVGNSRQLARLARFAAPVLLVSVGVYLAQSIQQKARPFLTAGKVIHSTHVSSNAKA